MAALVASRSRSEIEAVLKELSPNALAALPYLFEFWGAPDHQLPPPGAWRTWVILGGRGAGKTRAGAEWIRSKVEGATALDKGPCARVALIGATMDEARDVMVKGESGVIACSPPDRRPKWSEGDRTLTWPNGAMATCFSAANPEKLRGPQFDCAWSDELGKWSKARETWDMLQFGLRLGDRPQQLVTTTPAPNAVLEALLEDEDVVVSKAATWANKANLADGFLEAVEATYGGTVRGREELEGEMVFDRPGALWSRKTIEEARVKKAPDLKRVVVAVDPPATSGASADECGVVVAGVCHSGFAYVLADRSSQGDTPSDWAKRAVAAYEEFEADRIVAEVNQGGDLVEAVLRQVAPQVSYRAVRATRGKSARAEPVSALYEQGRVRHVGSFPELEDQMRGFGANGAGGSSPDRVDALVWAVTELVLGQQAGAPRVRGF